MLWILAILALGVLVIVHESGHFFVARLSKMRVDLFSIGFGPPIWRLTRGETSYQIAAVPLGGFVQIAGLNPGEEIDPEDPRAYPNRPAWQRFATIFAGPGINYLFAVLMLTALNLALGTKTEVKGQGAVVLMAQVNKPASQAGLRPGDDIVAIDGKPINGPPPVTQLIEGSAGKTLVMEVIRDGQRQTFQVTPRKDDHGKWRIGVSLGASREMRASLGAGRAITDGMVAPFWLTYRTAKHIIDGFRGGPKPEFGGPVEIVEAIKESFSIGWEYGLEFVALISTMLGFFNLLPLPALDGGRLVFLGWEIITRRPANARVEQVVHGVGMIFLLLVVGFLLLRGLRSKILGLF